MKCIEPEDRHAAFPRAGAVQPGDAESSMPLFCPMSECATSVYMRTCRSARRPPGWGERVGAARREVRRVTLPGARIATRDRRALQGIAIDRLVERPEIQVAVAAEDIELRRGVPVHLGIERPAIEFERRRDEVVVGLPGQIGHRQQADDLRCGRIDSILRNDVAGKRGAAHAVGGSSQQVVDGRRGCGQVAAAQRLCGHGHGSRRVLLVARPFVAAEVEQLVADERTAERPPNWWCAQSPFGVPTGVK